MASLRDQNFPKLVWFQIAANRIGASPREPSSPALPAIPQAAADARVACRVYVRRRAFNIHRPSAIAHTPDILERIGALCAVETNVRGQPPDVRYRAAGAHRVDDRYGRYASPTRFLLRLDLPLPTRTGHAVRVSQQRSGLARSFSHQICADALKAGRECVNGHSNPDERGRAKWCDEAIFDIAADITDDH